MPLRGPLVGLYIAIIYSHVCASFTMSTLRAHHVDNSTYCSRSSEIVMGCQAAVNYALRLVCGQCPADASKDTCDITWQRWSGEWRNIPGNNQTLEYPAKHVDSSLAGCYRCLCNLPEGGVYTVTISVDVKLPGEMCLV